VPGVGFRVSGVRCGVSDFGFSVPGVGFRVSGVRCGVSDFGFSVPGPGFWIFGSGFRVPDVGSRVLGFGFRGKPSPFRSRCRTLSRRFHRPACTADDGFRSGSSCTFKWRKCVEPFPPARHSNSMCRPRKWSSSSLGLINLEGLVEMSRHRHARATGLLQSMQWWVMRLITFQTALRVAKKRRGWLKLNLVEPAPHKPSRFYQFGSPTNPEHAPLRI